MSANVYKGFMTRSFRGSAGELPLGLIQELGEDYAEVPGLSIGILRRFIVNLD
jgi:hypothetical protein